MATASFDKNIVIREKEAVSKLVDILTKSKTKSFDEQLASAEAMTRSEEVLRSCLSRLKNS
jgi:hypothetical protein